MATKKKARKKRAWKLSGKSLSPADLKAARRAWASPALLTAEQRARQLERENRKLRKTLAVTERIFRNSTVTFDYEPLLKDDVGRSMIFRRIVSDISNIREDQKQLRTDLYEFFAAQQFGLNLSELKLHRLVPVKAYASEVKPSQDLLITKQIGNVGADFGFDLIDDYSAEQGSWYKKFWFRSREFLTQPEVVQRLEKGERAIELATLQHHQATIDKMQSEGAAGLIKAIDGVPKAAIQIGSILLLKLPGKDGQPKILVKTLTPQQMMALEKDPSLLLDPEDILSKLDSELSRSAPNELRRPVRAITLE